MREGLIIGLLKECLQAQKHLGIQQASITEKTVVDFFKNIRKAPPKQRETLTEPSPQQPSNVTIQTSCSPQENCEEITLPEGEKPFQWNWLKAKVLSCPICLSHVRSGKNVVFGSGNLDADIFFCGEAPGAEEEEQGEVFVGRAGQLLTRIIQAMGLQRSEVYIGNIMNWRPETDSMIGNRPPTQEEMKICLPYLKAQLALVKPKVIVALGATAVSGLLGHDGKRKMRDIRGKWFNFESIPMLVTYHPSYLLRNGSREAKRIVWEDMLAVMRYLNRPISEKQAAYFL